jgi:hypothetical protein
LTSLAVLPGIRVSVEHSINSIGADTEGGRGIVPLHFYSSIVSFAVSEWIRELKIFRLAALAIIIPPTCESESAPLIDNTSDHDPVTISTGLA